MNKIIEGMKEENFQKNLKCFLTAEIVDGQRVFKIIDGTHYQMRNAHVFYKGYTHDKGETIDAYIAMGKAIEKKYWDWSINNRNAIMLYYKNKK